MSLLNALLARFRAWRKARAEEKEDRETLIATVYVCSKCKMTTTQVYGKPKPTKCRYCAPSEHKPQDPVAG